MGGPDELVAVQDETEYSTIPYITVFGNMLAGFRQGPRRTDRQTEKNHKASDRLSEWQENARVHPGWLRLRASSQSEWAAVALQEPSRAHSLGES